MHLRVCFPPAIGEEIGICLHSATIVRLSLEPIEMDAFGLGQSSLLHIVKRQARHCRVNPESLSASAFTKSSYPSLNNAQP